jgi:ketosteroid isomerase-like protein
MNLERDQSEIRDTVIAVFSNWSSMKPEANDHLYLADDQTVLFDVAPMQDIGWAAQKARLNKVFEGFKEFWIKPNPDLAVHCTADMAWVTATWKAFIKLNTEVELSLEGRSTFVLEKKQRWLVVHDHVSVPNRTD